MKKVLCLMVLISGIWACQNNETSEKETATESQEAKTQEQTKPKNFGKVITADGAMSLQDLLGQMESKDSILNIKVMGKVGDVCQKKGCWMNVTDANSDKEIFVQFEDYGFFMPKDLTGSTVAMTGKAYVAVTSVEELKHYAEDEGKTKEEIAAITEPESQLKFLADGVVIVE